MLHFVVHPVVDRPKTTEELWAMYPKQMARRETLLAREMRRRLRDKRIHAKKH